MVVIYEFDLFGLNSLASKTILVSFLFHFFSNVRIFLSESFVNINVFMHKTYC